MSARRASTPPSKSIAATLLQWFDTHKRDLPWRRTHDPYAIWVSEIMLQQTRVNAVLDHYARWMARFPSVTALAAAEEPEVLALWSGLGYYRRARMLHKAARVVAEELHGVVPTTAEALRKLPGIGEYTSAAIASIAFGEAVPVVDGNVERIVTRLHGLAIAGSESILSATEMAKTIRREAGEFLVEGRAGDSNQAMMELGATVCLPRNPLCLHCPVQAWCKTRGEHVVAAKKPPVNRSVCYGLLQRMHDGEYEVLLHQRPHDASLMAGMWELPLLNAEPEGAEIAAKLRHAITVTNYAVTVVRCERNTVPVTSHERWFAVSNLPELALTGLARKTLRKVDLWPHP